MYFGYVRQVMLDFAGVLGLWIFAILLGLKHSFDADHLVAVTGVLSNAPTSKQTTKLSVSWALGHMVTASLLICHKYSQLMQLMAWISWWFPSWPSILSLNTS